MHTQGSLPIWLDWHHLTTVFFIVLTVYMWSAPRTVGIEDDGLFILAAYFNGIAHPPGYPLYTFLAHISTYIPIGSIAYRVHTLSALFGAAACVCLWSICRNLISDKLFAYIASFAFGFSQVFWSQAIIAEVYSLNVLLFFLLLLMSLTYAKEGSVDSCKLPVAIGLTYGLALCNHWPLIVLSTPVLLAILWPIRNRVFRFLPHFSIFVVIGLLPYVWMVIRSQMDPEISFFGAISNWSDFWAYVSRKNYANVDFNKSAGWWDKLQYVGFIGRETTNQFGPFSIFFVVIGFIRQWRQWAHPVSIGLTVGYLGSTVLLIGLLGFDYDLHHRNLFRVYPLISYGIAALWLALGVKSIIWWIIEDRKVAVSMKLLRVSLGVLVVGTILVANASENYRANNRWADSYARMILETLPPNAVLFVSQLRDVGSIGYINKVEGLRDDVTVYNGNGIVFSNRLFRADKINAVQKRQLINNFVNQTDQKIYYIFELLHDYGFKDYGVYMSVDKELPHHQKQMIIEPAITDYFHKTVSERRPANLAEKIHYGLLMENYCRLLIEVTPTVEDSAFKDSLKNLSNGVCQNYQSKVMLIELLLNQENPNWEYMRSLIKEANALRNQATIKYDYVRLDNFQGEMFLQLGDRSNAIQSFKKSIKMWPHPGNPAYARLSAISKKQN